jgi:hypothetical protein
MFLCTVYVYAEGLAALVAVVSVRLLCSAAAG